MTSIALDKVFLKRLYRELYTKYYTVPNQRVEIGSVEIQKGKYSVDNGSIVIQNC